MAQVLGKQAYRSYRAASQGLARLTRRMNGTVQGICIIRHRKHCHIGLSTYKLSCYKVLNHYIVLKNKVLATLGRHNLVTGMGDIRRLGDIEGLA